MSKNERNSKNETATKNETITNTAPVVDDKDVNAVDIISAPTKPLDHEPREAFVRMRPSIVGLDPARIIGVNVDVNQACGTALAAYPHYIVFRDIASRIPGFDVSPFDTISDYAQATLFAQGEVDGTVTPSAELPILAAEGADLREEIRLGLMAAAASKVLREPLPVVNTGNGYREISAGLMAVCSVAEHNAVDLGGKVAFSWEKVRRGQEIAVILAESVSARDRNPAVVAAAVDVRNRSFTLFARAYAQIRRLVEFLRFDEGDADDIAPSIYLRFSTKKAADAKN